MAEAEATWLLSECTTWTQIRPIHRQRTSNPRRLSLLVVLAPQRYRQDRNSNDKQLRMKASYKFFSYYHLAAYLCLYACLLLNSLSLPICFARGSISAACARCSANIIIPVDVLCCTQKLNGFRHTRINAHTFRWIVLFSVLENRRNRRTLAK